MSEIDVLDVRQNGCERSHKR